MRIEEKNLVIGCGEVGKAIMKVFNCRGIDMYNVRNASEPKVTNLHICFPYLEVFCDEVLEYKRIYKPDYIIVHSTVPVGTCTKIGAVHSPIRGIHPNLYEGIMAFHKFIGGPKSSEVADLFRKAGVKIIMCDKSETTELGKILDTEYYRACIEFTLKAKQHCKEFDVPFSEAYTLFNQTYNEGYVKLDHQEYVRPVLQPIEKPIGGHCVIPNSKFLDV